MITPAQNADSMPAGVLAPCDMQENESAGPYLDAMRQGGCQMVIPPCWGQPTTVGRLARAVGGQEQLVEHVLQRAC